MTVFSRTFNTTGTFFYRCEVHPTTMRGRIDVVIQDSDGDGWGDAAETTIGTDPLDGFADTATNDERAPASENPCPRGRQTSPTIGPLAAPT